MLETLLRPRHCYYWQHVGMSFQPCTGIPQARVSPATEAGLPCLQQGLCSWLGALGCHPREVLLQHKPNYIFIEVNSI